MEVWENITTELQGECQCVSITRPTVQHASPAKAQALCNDSITTKKKEGFEVSKDKNLAVVHFFLVTYDLAPWLNNNNKVDINVPTQQPLPPKQMLYLGQHQFTSPWGNFEELGKFSLSRDGRTLAVWVSTHGYDLAFDYGGNDADGGFFKVWIFHQKEQETDGGLLSFCKQPYDIFMGDGGNDLDTHEYSLNVVFSADGNMIAGYMHQGQTSYCLQVFDTPIGGGAQPLMAIDCEDFFRDRDIVQYAFCRENRLAYRREKKEHVVEELDSFVLLSQTFPAVIGFTVYYMKDGEDDDDDDDDDDPFDDSDADGYTYMCQCKHRFLPNYEKVKRGQTMHDSYEKHAFRYPCRSCKFDWTEERLKERSGAFIHACTSCSWQVEFPHKDEAYRKFDDILYHNALDVESSKED